MVIEKKTFRVGGKKFKTKSTAMNYAKKVGAKRIEERTESFSVGGRLKVTGRSGAANKKKGFFGL